MRLKKAALIAMTVTALAPAATAGAVQPGQCGKDYSKNAATGDYCAPVSTTSHSSFTTPAPASSSSDGDGSFVWGAAIGAGGALVLVAFASGAVSVSRRRSPATS